MRWTQWPTSAVRVRDALGVEAAVDRPPRPPIVVAAEGARGRDRHEDPSRLLRIQHDRVQAHAARAGLPRGRGGVRPQPGQLVPALAAVGGAEERRVLDARVHGVGIGGRGLEVPYPRELPGMRGAVVPLVRAGGAVVDELVADRLPALAAVARALDDLAEPAAGLGGVEALRIRRRALEMIDLPAPEVRTAHVPALAPPVRRQDERALARADQYPYAAHASLLPGCALRGRAVVAFRDVPVYYMVVRAGVRSTAREGIDVAGRTRSSRDD